MYTTVQMLAIPRGLTALENAPKVFKRLTGAINRIRREIRPPENPFGDTFVFTVILPGCVAHPTTTAYNLHYVLHLYDCLIRPKKGGEFRSEQSGLYYCTCGNHTPAGTHEWQAEQPDPFDETWIHVFASWPFVLEKLEEEYGPGFRQRIEQLERAAKLIGPYI